VYVFILFLVQELSELLLVSEVVRTRKNVYHNIGSHNNIILSKGPHAKFIDTTASVDE